MATRGSARGKRIAKWALIGLLIWEGANAAVGIAGGVYVAVQYTESQKHARN